MAIESDSFLVCKTLPKHKFVLGNQYVSRVICKVTKKSNVSYVLGFVSLKLALLSHLSFTSAKTEFGVKKQQQKVKTFNFLSKEANKS